MANEDRNSLSFQNIIETSKKFQDLKLELQTAVKVSLTGITNLVVNYEDIHLVNVFLENCFKTSELYRSTSNIDAVELQRGMPGRGFAAQYLDALIFGSYETTSGPDGSKIPAVDPKTGKRIRNADGFVYRQEITNDKIEDRLLIIRNLDYCMDFCQETPGVIDARNLWIFDNFRDIKTRLKGRILLITNEHIKLPFKIRTLNFDPVDELEAKNIIVNFRKKYEKKGFILNITETQEQQMVRKLCGHTYTEAGDAFIEAVSSETHISKEINVIKVLKNLREKINRNLMEEASGLSHLTAQPWEDYICPESSSFTYDVKKIVRDFDEINTLKIKEKEALEKQVDFIKVTKTIEAIRSRMPHVIVLYGRGGLGKSAFPKHFAGLLDFDIWDFNVNALHSMWVGQGSERAREALTRINKASHLVIRIDEYDRAMGSTQASGQDMHSAHKQVETEFMNWLQNSQEENIFIKNDIFVILTTNHKENITGPLLRSGRADLVIDINEFDDKSMRESFISSPRRMKNRNLCPPVGFNSFEDLSKAIEKLDLSQITLLASQKGFTVRDVDTLLIEMAAHDYYFKQGKDTIPWTTDSFIRVLENSNGSSKDENTSELTLGDRFFANENSKKEPQSCFDFIKDFEFNEEKFKEVNFLK